MATIELRGTDEAEVKALSEQMVKDLTALGVEADWQIEYKTEINTDEALRSGDLTAYIPIAVAAVSAGGALTVLLSSDGILAKIAQYFEKRLENKKSEIIIKAADGSSIELRSAMTPEQIKTILREVNRRDAAGPTTHTNSTTPNP